MRLRVTRRAFLDLKQIQRYLARHWPESTQSVLSRLDQALARIAEHPSAGTPTDVDDVNVVFVGRYPYKVFYRVHGTEVQIVHIRHTSRDAPELDEAA